MGFSPSPVYGGGLGWGRAALKQARALLDAPPAHDFVIPRVVAESMRRILIHRRMDSATTLHFAQNDDLVRLHGNDENNSSTPKRSLFLRLFSIANTY